jgi:hypothetical protein
MRIHATLWIALAALSGASTLAQAAPPTVVPSPGYDARLQEQRAAANRAATAAPVTSGNPTAATHRHTKKKHSN